MLRCETLEIQFHRKIIKVSEWEIAEDFLNFFWKKRQRKEISRHDVNHLIFQTIEGVCLNHKKRHHADDEGEEEKELEEDIRYAKGSQ